MDDPKALDLDFRATLSFHVDGGNMTNVKVHVDHFSVGGRDIELLSNDLASDDESFWVLTKAYGRMKVTSDAPQNSFDLWMPPSQRKALKALHASQQ